MFFGTSQTGSHSATVIFTIGSARVTASITSKDSSGKVIVHYSTNTTFAYQEDLDIERFTRSMISALMEVSMRLNQEGVQALKKNKTGLKIREYHCVFTAPWFVSQTRKVTLRRKKPFTIKASTIDSLLKDEVVTFQNQVASNEKDYSLISGNSIVTDAHVVRTELNGYTTHSPIGKTADRLSLTIYTSLMSEEIIGKTREIIQKVFHADDIVVLSSTLISYLAIEDLFHPEDSYTVIEVNGEVTDVSIVYDHVLLESASYPIGTNSVTRDVCKKLNKQPADVESRLKLMAQAKADRSSTETQKFEDAVYETISSWVTGLYESLESIAKGRPVPQTTYLIVDPLWEVLYLTALKDRSFELFTFSDRPFTVITINSSSIKDRAEVSKKSDFVPLAIATGLVGDSLKNE